MPAERRPRGGGPETFGQRVRRLREGRGLSQGQVAEAIGVLRPYYTLVEHDQAWEQRIRQVAALADALGVTTDALLGRTTGTEGR